MELKYFISDILPVISIAGTLFVYFYHGNKINKQTKIIQEFEIDKLRFEKEDRLKANIVALFISKSSNSQAIQIKNIGKSDARNVRVSVIPSDNSFQVGYRHTPYELLLTGNSFELGVMLASGHMDTYYVELIWDDDFELNRVALVPIHI